jgi:hypothetical protein
VASRYRSIENRPFRFSRHKEKTILPMEPGARTTGRGNDIRGSFKKLKKKTQGRWRKPVCLRNDRRQSVRQRPLIFCFEAFSYANRYPLRLKTL